MEPDFFAYLPLEIIPKILLRLSVRTIAIGKCVCKSWLDLFSSDDFVDLHFSQSSPALAVLMRSDRCTLFGITDQLDRPCIPLINSPFPHGVAIDGAAGGMLLLTFAGTQTEIETLRVCNPITRECVELCCPPPPLAMEFGPRTVYGFGASKTSGEYKVVRISPYPDCHVYTLGPVEMWRCVEMNNSLNYEDDGCSCGAFVNGNLHWLVYSDLDGSAWISCFDLEAECFTAFSVPLSYESLSVLRDCLCVCEYTLDNEIVIWTMKEYGVDQSWAKEYVISRNPGFDRRGYKSVYPIKVFENGDILMLWGAKFLMYYSKEMRTTQEIGGFESEGYTCNRMIVTPSLVTLKRLGMENVISILAD
ncbi:F-box protein CPR1-like [Salvia hispanica]|uniref:F-box protein CPR1-like n=1 Tax=Salvia hispanica TaxID=49212 RepID=UPI0020093CC2|nr:F-box protein CPR1-like [Salvia hispanica]XP_047966311.1 F-box protein CPR1-like [Salvia hispanica]